MKTIIQALKDECLYPIPEGKIENIILTRNMDGDAEFSSAVASSVSYKGALADCLYSLIQTINFSEAGMSVGSLTDGQRKAILKRANGLYGEIGEPLVDDGDTPKVYINC